MDTEATKEGITKHWCIYGNNKEDYKNLQVGPKQCLTLICIHFTKNFHITL